VWEGGGKAAVRTGCSSSGTCSTLRRRARPAGAGPCSDNPGCGGRWEDDDGGEGNGATGGSAMASVIGRQGCGGSSSGGGGRREVVLKIKPTR
jgi:hypothetical protein